MTDKIIKFLVSNKYIASLVIMSPFLANPGKVFAQVLPPTTPIPGGGNNGVQGGLQQIETQANPTGIRLSGNREDLVALIGRVINWALYVSGAVAVIFVIIGGYLYLTSAGNDDQAKKGRKTLTNALIGIVIIVLAYVIVNVVVSFITRST